MYLGFSSSRLSSSKKKKKNVGYILVLYSSALNQGLGIHAQFAFVFPIHLPTSYSYDIKRQRGR